jgi:DNA-binding response OmpR family regulator
MVSDKLDILIVEDDISLLNMMQQMLELEGFGIITAVNGENAIKIFETQSPSLVLLDIVLPDTNGLSVCKSIRRFSNVPIIMVTGKSETEDKVEGLYAGADDYVTKPFSYSELIARVNAVLRRTTYPEERFSRPAFQCHDLKIDFAKQLVTIHGEKVEVTSTEYRVLAFLAVHAGRIVHQDEILKEVWGDDFAAAVHMLQVNISRLRQKLNDNVRKFKYIETRAGQGYILNKQE